MASAEKTDIFDCTPEQFYSLITDFDSYGEFIDEVVECFIVEDMGDEKVVQYDVKVVKNFSYKLLMQFDEPNSLTWSFHSGDLFKVSNGSWTLEATGDGKTKATYWVEAEFKLFVPGPIAKALVGVNLPNMFAAYHDKVAECFS